jgi:hypothetical protein
MKLPGLAGVLGVALLAATPAWAQAQQQSEPTPQAPYAYNPLSHMWQSLVVDPTTGAPSVADAYSAPYGGETPMVVGTPTTARRAVKANCTSAGNVSVTYADGSTGTWAVTVGTQTLPISATTVNAAGTTATCTYAELK